MQDAYEYPDEVFQVVLSDLRYDGQPVYSLQFGEFTTLNITIDDDGDAGTLVFDSARHEQMEQVGRDANYTITVTRVGRPVPDGDITVRFNSEGVTAVAANASAGVSGDYIETEGTLRFDSAVTWASLVVTVKDDMEYEVGGGPELLSRGIVTPRTDAAVCAPQRPDETLLVHLSDARYLGQPVWSLNIGSLNTTTLTILDDGDAGTMGFTPTRYSIMEGSDMTAVNRTFTVTRYGREAPSQMFTLRYTTASDTARSEDADFVHTQGLLTFADNQTVAVFVVEVLDDMLFEVRAAEWRPRVRSVSLRRPQYPDETFNVTIDEYRYLGTEPPDYSTRIDAELDTAVNTILDDGDAGARAAVSWPSGSAGSSHGRFTGTIAFAVKSYEIREAGAVAGNGPDQTVTLTLTRFGREFPSRRITVQYFTADGTAVAGSDYVAVGRGSQVVSFADGQTNATLTLAVRDDG